MVRSFRRGFSLIGMIVTLAIIVILIAITVPAMKQGLGGGGTGIQQNQASTVSDAINLKQIGQSLVIFASQNDGHFPSPMLIAQKNDWSLNTSANFWSSLIAQRLVSPQQLVSGNENSSYVFEATSYDDSAYSPAMGTHWDPNFKADLSRDSHVSFAHGVLYGERHRRNWSMSAPGNFPMVGNRGPQDGVPNPQSWCVDPATGMWKGNLVYSDGHTRFHQTPMPEGITYSGRTSSGPDNIFKVDDGQNGIDCILGFTRAIGNNGFELQWD